MIRRLTIALAATLVAGALYPALGSAAVEKHSASDKADGVRAVLSWKEDDEQIFSARDLELRIFHKGKLAYTAQVGRTCKGCSQQPTGQGKKGKPVRVRNLDRDGPPEVTVDIYTGGAHCCTNTVAFDRRGEDYRIFNHNWLDSGYRLRDRNDDGIPEFRSSDAKFGYLYDCFACSFFPVQVVAFRRGFDDVTSDFPALVRRQARDLRDAYRERKGKDNVRAILAAYVADRCNLGSCESGFRLVENALEKGYLDRQGKTDLFKPYGTRYVRSLRRILDKFGYR